MIIFFWIQCPTEIHCCGLLYKAFLPISFNMIYYFVYDRSMLSRTSLSTRITWAVIQLKTVFEQIKWLIKTCANISQFESNAFQPHDDETFDEKKTKCFKPLYNLHHKIMIQVRMGCFNVQPHWLIPYKWSWSFYFPDFDARSPSKNVKNDRARSQRVFDIHFFALIWPKNSLSSYLSKF